jgi:hypothetical protein
MLPCNHSLAPPSQNARSNEITDVSFFRVLLYLWTSPWQINRARKIRTPTTTTWFIGDETELPGYKWPKKKKKKSNGPDGSWTHVTPNPLPPNFEPFQFRTCIRTCHVSKISIRWSVMTTTLLGRDVCLLRETTLEYDYLALSVFSKRNDTCHRTVRASGISVVEGRSWVGVSSEDVTSTGSTIQCG